MNIEKLVQEMNEKTSITEMKQFLKETIRSISPDKPRKPYLNSKHTVEDVKVYTIAVEQYEKDMIDYESKKEVFNKVHSALSENMHNHIKQNSGLYDFVPEQYQEKVYSYVRNRVSSYYEIDNELSDLIDIFK